MDNDRLIHIFTDVTPMKETELQLMRTVEELKRTNANLEEFAYAASHDLQEPLRKIQYFSERLKTSLAAAMPQEERKMLERIEAATSRMWQLIEDLLQYSRVSVRPDALKQVALNDLVHRVMQDFEPTIIQTGAKINIHPLPHINGDERQLHQLFQNLIGNALKYRKPDEKPEVTIRSAMLPPTHPLLQHVPDAKKEAYHLIEISDNGIGFQQEQAEKIFQVFHRLHGRSEYEGTGIGLAIVQKVVKNHGGLIIAQGEPDKGATFRILLPA
jgi:light-regulated signal transduction histidine kinase (bacteriophytochrome)